MKVVSICGSPGAGSANRAVLLHAAKHLVATNDDIEIVEASLQDVPVFDSRLADDPPQAVTELSGLFKEADGVMIAAPEYAGGLAGGTKTALDWMVRLASLYHRPVVVLSVGTTGGDFAIEQLVRTLTWQGALVVDTLGIASPRTKIDETGAVADPELAASLDHWADCLVDAISSDWNGQLARVSKVISPLGIDPARFG